MTEENVNGIDGAGKRAGIILRFTAGLMDFFLFYTGGTYFFSLDTVSFEIFLLIVIAAAVLYEIVLQDTPAKKLLNMKTVYEKKNPRVLCAAAVSEIRAGGRIFPVQAL